MIRFAICDYEKHMSDYIRAFVSDCFRKKNRRIQGDFFMMEIENSFHGKGAFKKGTGLSNVNAAAEKYGGAMSIETQENVYVLHVLHHSTASRKQTTANGLKCYFLQTKKKRKAVCKGGSRQLQRSCLTISN